MTDENSNNNDATPAVNNVSDLDGFRKKKMPTKVELLNKTIGKEQEYNKKFETVQLILNNLNKRMKDTEDKMSNDIMQSIILILALKEAITQELKIDDERWNAIVGGVTKKLAEEREKDYDEKNGLVTVDRPAINGDILIVSFKGTIDGKPFDGGSSEGILISVGSKFFLEDFENSLIGKKKEDVYSTPVKFPDNYSVKNLASKEAIFEIKILSVKEKKQGDKPNEPTVA